MILTGNAVIITVIDIRYFTDIHTLINELIIINCILAPNFEDRMGLIYLTALKNTEIRVPSDDII